MENEAMDMQKLTFFTEGNTFTGSRTKDWKAMTMLRYLVKPDKENGKLLAFCWTQDVCFEKSEDHITAEFPLSDAGIDQAGAWLLEQYNNL